MRQGVKPNKLRILFRLTLSFELFTDKLDLITRQGVKPNKLIILFKLTLS